MKEKSALLALTAAGGAAGFALRLLQNRTGYEAHTGLPIPGAAVHWLLPAVLALLGVGFCLCARSLPRRCRALFYDTFQTGRTALLAAAVGGAALMGLSGALTLLATFEDAAVILSPTGTLRAVSGLSAVSARVTGLLALVMAAALLPVAASCRAQEEGGAVRGTALLIPPVCLVVDLVLAYRVHSINPTLSAYYVELLLIMALIMGFYQLSSFAFGEGRPRRLGVFAAAADVLALTLLADGADFSTLLYLGGAAALTAFFLMAHFREEEAEPEEEH